jgi:hydroxyacylglutathione hydrolase
MVKTEAAKSEWRRGGGGREAHRIFARSRFSRTNEAMATHIHQFLCLKDNFGVLVHDPHTRATASIDAPEAGPILAALAAREWELTDVLITHHHADHVQGIAGLKAKYPRARAIGPAKEARKIGGLDLAIGEGDVVVTGALEAKVIEVPGHTSGHVAYWFEDEDILFAGDTLFAMGCGRAFEERPAVLFHSLMKLAALPGETQVYCGHEYTLANARFALTVDSSNAILTERAAAAARQREAGEFTLPTTITIELATNPFLRADDPNIQAGLGMAGADPVAVFTELRERKNRM